MAAAAEACSLICRICLADNIKLYNIANSRLAEMFEKLTDDKISAPGRPETLCYICCSQLQRSCRFLDTFHRTDKIVNNLTLSGVELTPETISIVNQKMPKHYTITPIEITNMPNLTEDTKVSVKEEVAVKQEPEDLGSEVHEEEIEGAPTAKKPKIDEIKAPATKAFACDSCEKSFDQIRQLNGHKKVHKQKKRKTQKKAK